MVGVAIALLLVAAGLWWTKGSHDDDASGADATTSTPSADATTTTPTGSDGSAADGSESTSPATEPELGSERELVFLRGASGTKSIIAQDEPIALADADPIKASLSDDGTMALIVRTDDGARLALGRVDEPDVQVLEVSQGNVQDVDIAPDGSQIAFTDEAGGDTDIAVLDLSTLEVRTLLASSGDDRDPAWSSDSTRVAAVRSRSSGSEIVIIDASSGAATPVTDGAREVSSPTWSPDDQQIAYLRRDGGSVDIVVQEVTDPDPKLLALTPDQELDVTWCPGGLVASYARRGLVEFSPDGSSEDLTDSPGDANPNC